MRDGVRRKEAVQGVRDKQGWERGVEKIWDRG